MCVSQSVRWKTETRSTKKSHTRNGLDIIIERITAIEKRKTLNDTRSKDFSDDRTCGLKIYRDIFFARTYMRHEWTRNARTRRECPHLHIKFTRISRD